MAKFSTNLLAQPDVIKVKKLTAEEKAQEKSEKLKKVKKGKKK